MKKIILKIAVIGSLLFFMAACSKKTVSQDSNQSPPRNQQARQARGERPQFADLLSQMDEDKDGKLSMVEVKGPLQNNFTQIDKNEDGFISEAEFKASPPPQRRGRK